MSRTATGVLLGVAAWLLTAGPPGRIGRRDRGGAAVRRLPCQAGGRHGRRARQRDLDGALRLGGRHGRSPGRDRRARERLHPPSRRLDRDERARRPALPGGRRGRVRGRAARAIRRVCLRRRAGRPAHRRAGGSASGRSPPAPRTVTGTRWSGRWRSACPTASRTRRRSSSTARPPTSSSARPPMPPARPGSSTGATSPSSRSRTASCPSCGWPGTARTSTSARRCSSSGFRVS